MLFKFIDLRYFLISLSVGLLYIYLTEDFKKVIIVYPHPDNINKYTYVDKVDNCFNYELNPNDCPSSSSKYTEIQANY